MAQQTINVGTAPNDGTGTPLRTAFQYTNSNFSELYTAVGPSGNNIVVPGTATITGDLTVDTNTLKVDSANDRVGVGTVSPTAKLHVSSTGSVHINQRTGGNGCFTQYVDPVSSNYVGTDSGNFRVANNSAQDLLNIQQLGVFTFGDGAGGTRMTLNSTGLGIGVTPSAGGGCLQLSSGITFPATQVASSDANTLDDYEEGNWTPTVGDASSGGNQATTATAVGRYTKIGRLVTVQWELTDINTTGLTAGNAVYIRGLPFSSSSATTQFGTPAVSGVTFSGYLTVGVFNGSSFPIYSSSSGGSLADIKVSALASGTADIWGTLTYIV